jgi:hypothetical protein
MKKSSDPRKNIHGQKKEFKTFESRLVVRVSVIKARRAASFAQFEAQKDGRDYTEMIVPAKMEGEMADGTQNDQNFWSHHGMSSSSSGCF